MATWTSGSSSVGESGSYGAGRFTMSWHISAPMAASAQPEVEV